MFDAVEPHANRVAVDDVHYLGGDGANRDACYGPRRLLGFQAHQEGGDPRPCVQPVPVAGCILPDDLHDVAGASAAHNGEVRAGAGAQICISQHSGGYRGV